jgi:hypothetical protein
MSRAQGPYANSNPGGQRAARVRGGAERGAPYGGASEAHTIFRFDWRGWIGPNPAAQRQRSRKGATS